MRFIYARSSFQIHIQQRLLATLEHGGSRGRYSQTCTNFRLKSRVASTASLRPSLGDAHRCGPQLSRGRLREATTFSCLKQKPTLSSSAMTDSSAERGLAPRRPVGWKVVRKPLTRRRAVSDLRNTTSNRSAEFFSFESAVPH
jgi:hypothetical protein